MELKSKMSFQLYIKKVFTSDKRKIDTIVFIFVLVTLIKFRIESFGCYCNIYLTPSENAPSRNKSEL